MASLSSAAWYQPFTGHGRRAAWEVEGSRLSDRLLPSRHREVRAAGGKRSVFVAVGRSYKFAYAERHEEANKMVAAQFLRNLMAAIPDKIHTVLTDNGIQFTKRKRDIYAFHHIFDRVCQENGIDHRSTETSHRWTNGQAERMNRTLKHATVKTYDNETHDHLKAHLQAFLMAYNFAKRLKTLKGLMNASANAGRKSRNALPSTHAITPWD
jgi:transposase InsO family protein